MDWYLGCAVDDLAVPGNQEVLDMFPSPNGYPQWELSSSEAFDPMGKCFVTQTSGLNFNKKSQNKVSMDLFENLQEKQSLNPNFLQELKEGLVNQETSSCYVSDYQLDHLDMTNQTDGVYLNSSYNTGADTSKGPFDFYHPDFENDDYGDNDFENMITKSEYDPSNLFGMGSIKYVKTHAFSPSVGGGDSICTTHFPEHRNNQYPPIKAQYEEVSASPEFEIMDEHTNEETLALQELESVITQMSNHTRICFRDALYRLAESSRQHSMDLVSERSAPLMVSDGNFGSGSSRDAEAETNTIDRAVANLMFCKMDSSAQNLPHCHSSLSGDSEVPIFS